MTVALLDNGSLEPAAHRHLRAVAATLAARAGVPVHAVSWQHSDRLPAAALDGAPAPVLAAWVRDQLARGARDFVFVPFFLSAQGAIGSALRLDLEALRRAAGPFDFNFTAGLAASGVIPAIVAARIRETRAARRLPATTPLLVVDHGGPSPVSAALRDTLAAQVRAALRADAGPLLAASMEGAAHAHNRPLLADALAAPRFDRGDVVVAPLFLSPGRHAGDGGDLDQICRAAEARAPGLRCHRAALVGTHPLAAAALADALVAHLAQFSHP